MFKAFLVIFSYVTSYEFKNLVEVAGVEPASANTTLENTTCLDIVYYFNTLRPDEQGSKCDPLSLV